jgi:hypothetical protein
MRAARFHEGNSRVPRS